MSKIRGEKNKPEEIVCKFLFSKGFRYRRNDKRFPGRPDIVLPKYKTIVFVHGCFWHGHQDCKASKLPKSNVNFWRKKITNNKERDRRNIDKLEDDGWNVLLIWECEINSINKRNFKLGKLLEELSGKKKK